jgi:glucose/arabinose dehydrogenase
MTAAILLLGLPLALPLGSIGPARPLEQIRLELVAEGLRQPTGLVSSPDETGRIFVLEQAGIARIVRDGTLDAEPFLDLSEDVVVGEEQGLLGLAFHPAFATNGRVFVDYTDTAGDTIVAEYTANGDSVDPESVRQILFIDQPHELHNGGGLAFGPDGYLYIGVGDGGWPNDVVGTGQNTDRLFGTILRVDVDNRADDEPYSIPEGNPFADGGGRAEIWDYGLRNPWRFSFDPASGDLFIADVGYLAYEEINRHPATSPGGLNFGWSITEGFRCFQADSCEDDGLVPPLIEYGGRRLATGNCAIIGGPVYRGADEPALDGRLIYGDFCSGRIWTFYVDEFGAVPQEQLDTRLVISTFGSDPDGLPLVADYARGAIYRIRSSASSGVADRGGSGP